MNAPPAEIGYIALGREAKKIGFMKLENWARKKDDRLGMRSPMRC